MKTDKQLLIEGRALISDPAKWTQHFFAKNTYGFCVDENSEDAVCFCSWGALSHVQGHFVDDDASAFSILKQAMGDTVANFNDTHTHEEVLAAWDKAIASLP